MNVEVKMAYVVGALLVAVGLFGFFITGMTSITALIPAIPGVLILIGAFMAMRPNMLKHGMHLAAAAALLGFLAALRPVFVSEGAAFISGLIMLILCLIFVIVAIRSFINARKARQE